MNELAIMTENAVKPVEHKIVESTPDEICRQCNQCFEGECRAHYMSHSKEEEESRRRGHYGVECDSLAKKRYRSSRYGLRYRTPAGRFECS